MTRAEHATEIQDHLDKALIAASFLFDALPPDDPHRDTALVLAGVISGAENIASQVLPGLAEDK